MRKLDSKIDNKILFKNNFVLILFFILIFQIIYFLVLDYLPTSKFYNFSPLRERSNLYWMLFNEIRITELFFPFLNIKILTRDLSLSYHNSYLELYSSLGFFYFIFLLVYILNIFKNMDFEKYLFLYGFLIIFFVFDMLHTSITFIYFTIFYAVILSIFSKKISSK